MKQKIEIKNIELLKYNSLLEGDIFRGIQGLIKKSSSIGYSAIRTLMEIKPLIKKIF